MHQEYKVEERELGKEFVIYQSPKAGNRFERVSRIVGFSFLALSFSSLLLFSSPIIISELNFRLNNSKSDLQTVDKEEINRFGQLLWFDSKGIISPADRDFGIIIPSIGVNEKVLANIDAANEKEYNVALKNGLVHAKGSALPGEEGTIYIFGHSSSSLLNIGRLSKIFYLLKNVEVGNEIVLVFGNKSFFYQATEKKIVGSGELSYLSSDGKDRLVLQTCWPPLTNWKRLVIVAEPTHPITALPETALRKSGGEGKARFQASPKVMQSG